jgi:hypothetical protein
VHQNNCPATPRNQLNKKDNYTPRAKKGPAANNGHTLEDLYENGITKPQ